MAEQNAIVAIAPRKSLVTKFAEKYSIEPDKLMGILKATAFKVKDGEVSNEQMAALLVVADQYGLNPFTKEIFAFPDKQNGIVPVVGVDGWSHIINDHAQADGFEFRQSEEIVNLPDAKPCPAWMEVVVYRKDRQHPIIVREYLDEVYRPPFTYSDGGKRAGPWQTHTKRFLRHKTLIQGARVAFGFAGIYDEDEAQRIVEREVQGEVQGEVVTEKSATERLRGALAGKSNGDESNVAPGAGVAPAKDSGSLPGAPEAATATEAKPRGKSKGKAPEPGDREKFEAKMLECTDPDVLNLVMDDVRLSGLPKEEVEALERIYAGRQAELTGKQG